MTDRPNATPDHADSRAPQIAGFWRRIAAVLIDSMVLGVFGICLGLLWFDRLAAFGSLGRLIGGAIALAYFGFLNSHIGRGQTIGKRALKIRVVDANSTTVSFLRSIARAFVLLLPITLNGMYIPISEATPFTSAALTVCIFGLGGALVYLYLFNRRTRQSLHDLAARTFVVNAQDSGEIHERIWKPHLAFVFGWILVSGVVVRPLSELFVHSETYQGLLDLQRAAQSVAPEAQVAVQRGTRTAATLQDGLSSAAFVQVSVVTPVKPESYEELGDRIAAAILPAHPEIRDVASVTISISYGYDIMISRMHTTQTFSHSPQEWDERLKLRPRSGSSA